MKYHAPTKQFVIDMQTIEFVTLSFLNAMKHIRLSEGLPLEPYKRDTQLTHADHAQKNIIDAADRMGIDLGARWGNEIDLREAGQ